MSRLTSFKSLGLVLAAALTFAVAPLAGAQDASVVKTVPALGAPALITGKVDESKLTAINEPKLPEGVKDLGPADGNMKMGLQLVLRRSGAQEEALKLFNQQSLDPTSPMFAKVFSPSEFAGTFGLAASDLAALKAALAGSGFTVGNIDNGRLTIDFEGTVSQVNSAFHTEIRNYAAKDGSQHFANATAVQIPKAFGLVVRSVNGLQNFTPMSRPGFGAPVADFAGSTEKIQIAAGKAPEVKLDGEGLHDASFTASKYILGLKESATLNVRIGGNNHPATGSLSIEDQSGKVIGLVADITSCEPYNGGFGRSCTANFKPPVGTSFLKAIYSGDSNTRGVIIEGSPISRVGTQLDGVGATIAPQESLPSANVSATVTTTLSYAGSAFPTGTIYAYYNGTTSAAWGAAVLSPTGAATSGSGTSSENFAYTYSCAAANTTTQTITCTITNSNAFLDLLEAFGGYGALALNLTYSGDTNYASAAGNAEPFVIRNTPTTTTTTAVSGTLAAATYGTVSTYSPSVVITASANAGNLGNTTQYYTGLIAYGSIATGTVANANQLGTPIYYNVGAATSCGTTNCTPFAATFSTPADLAPGTYTVTYYYSGNAFAATAATYHADPSSTTDTFVVNKFTPTLGSVTASPVSVTQGSSTAVTLTGTIVIPAVGVKPSGAVTYTVNGVAYTATCAYPGSSGTLTCTATIPAATVAALAKGSYTISAAFAGDSFYNSATNASAGTFVVTNVSSSLTAAPTSVTYGNGASAGTDQSVTLTDTLTFATGVTPVSTDTVTFTNSSGVTAIGSVAISACTHSGQVYTCSYVWTPPATASGDNAGSYTVTASFSGDVNASASVATTPFTINQDGTTTTLTANPTTVNNGTPSTTLTSVTTWNAPGYGVNPTGTISFTCASAPGSTNTCASLPPTMTFGTASCSAAPAPTRTVTCSESVNVDGNARGYGGLVFTATYSGDTNYSTSNGSATVGDSRGAASTTAISVTSGSPVAYGSGTSVGFSVVVTGISGDGAPIGSLVLTNATLGTLATVQTSTCTATNSYTYTCAISYPVPAATAIGSYTVTATYNSTAAYYNNSTGTTSFSVAKANVTAAVTSVTPNSEQYGTGTPVAVAGTLTYVGSGTPPSLSQLTFTSTAPGTFSALSCSGTSSPLSCTATFTPATTDAVGSYGINLSFLGDTDYNATASTNTANFTITPTAPTVSLSNVSAPLGSTAGVSITVTATNDNGATATFGTAGGVGGSFSPPTCVISSNTCSVSYIPSGTAAFGAHPNDLTVSVAANGNYSTGTASSTLTITSATSALGLTAATPGTTTTGTTSSLLTATMSPAVSGVTVTFTDTTTGATLGTGTTNASGVATLTVTTSTTGLAAGLDVIQASISAGSGYSAATSTSVNTYFAGLLFSTSGFHNFSTDPGTVDGTKLGPYGVSIYNFTSTTQPITVNFTNSASGAFSYVNACGTTLAAGKSCSISFYYAPPYGDGNSATVGQFESASWNVPAPAGVLEGIGTSGITRSGPVSLPGELGGKALLSSGTLSINPQAISFGTVAAGTTSKTVTVIVTNPGSTPLSFTYAGPSAPFTVNNTCASPLAGGASCNVYVSVESSTNGPVTDQMTFTPAGGSAEVVTMSATIAASTNGLTLTTQSHNFGNVTLNSSVQFGLGITNNSSTAATLSFVPSVTAGFTVNSSSCPSSLAAGASCNLYVTFDPTTTGSVTETVTIDSDHPILPGGTGSGSAYADVTTFTGTGVTGGQFTATSVGHNFGSFAVGTSGGNYGVQLSNNTGVAISLTTGPLANTTTGFSVVSNSCGPKLANNANCELIFTFTPTATGTVSTTFPVTGDAQLYSGGIAYNQITLTGTGQ